MARIIALNYQSTPEDAGDGLHQLTLEAGGCRIGIAEDPDGRVLLHIDPLGRDHLSRLAVSELSGHSLQVRLRVRGVPVSEATMTQIAAHAVTAAAADLASGRGDRDSILRTLQVLHEGLEAHREALLRAEGG